MRLRNAALLLLTVGAALALTIPGFAAQAPRGSLIRLRRATFDPLRNAPTLSSDLRAAPASTLRLVQLAGPPTAATEAALSAAGMRLLLYIPDNTFLVRLTGAPQSLGALRWSGPFEVGYKLAPELDSALAAASESSETVQLMATPDADPAALAAALQSAGGRVLSRANGLNGPSFRVTLTEAALAGLLRRDDIIWAERYHAPQVFNDKGREIIGVNAARAQFGWLTGAGQIVAVTDTGLDQANQVSADFAGRVKRAYGPQSMNASCTSNDWSDLNGHGTHVSGTVLGSGALSPPGLSFAGVAPEAQLVVEAVSSGGSSLDCLGSGDDFLTKAYNDGARVQNASWGGSTGSGYGGYDDLAQTVDSFLWAHDDHLLVVAAGNEGVDDDNNGVIDPDSIGTPATAKNVLAVGATENNRPPTRASCSVSDSPQNFCWSAYRFNIGAPFANDFISDNINGMAAFSSRGPADDGRIKPEIVAPGTNVISSASHAATYALPYDANYATDSGTSMATPMLSGAAALVRQWLAHERGIATPSAALVKALLLNGATNITPGQYGAGAQREIPAAWPNNVEGWGRANVAASVQLDGANLWFDDQRQGLATGESASYSFQVAAPAPLRVTLAWTDYPGSPIAARALVNDLDLEVQAPDGTISYGNASADLSANSACRSGSADRCNNVESVEIAAPQIGSYTLRVRAASVPHGPQRFALVARAAAAPSTAPTLSAALVNGPTVSLTWTSVNGATSYELQSSSDPAFAGIPTTRTIGATSASTVEEIGSYSYRVRACNSAGCGPFSNSVSATIVTPPQKSYVPNVRSP